MHWTNRHVEPSTIHRTVNKIRKALEDSTTNVRFIRTFPKRGYQFVAEIDVPLPTSKLQNSNPPCAQDQLVAGQLLCRTPTRIRIREAAECFTRAGQDDPSLGAAFVNLIVTQLHHADRGEPWWSCHARTLNASKQLEAGACLELDRVAGQALLLHMQEHDRDADALLDRLLNLDTNHEIGLFYSARTKMILDDYRGVVGACRKFVEIDPLAPAANLLLAEGLNCIGQQAEALGHGANAEAIWEGLINFVHQLPDGPAHPIAHSLLFLSHARMGRVELALEALSRGYAAGGLEVTFFDLIGVTHDPHNDWHGVGRSKMYLEFTAMAEKTSRHNTHGLRQKCQSYC